VISPYERRRKQEANMNTSSKILIGTIAGFMAVAYSLVFRVKKVQSGKEIGERAGEPRHW
jgi:hypothetical protein